VSCEKIRAQLTSYLDGELADDRGSVVRGHLRGCAECRQVATDEAALRDGMRALPPLDPPASLWAGVQARLAAEEVADAERPAWRRVLARWMPRAPQLALGSALVAAAVVLVVIRAQRGDESEPAKVVSPAQKLNVEIKPDHPPTPDPAPAPVLDDHRDVSEVLAAAPAQLSEDHAAVVRELMPLAEDARTRWTEEQRKTFDTHLADLQREVSGAKTERQRQKHYRTLIRFLQRAAIRDEVALAFAPGGTGREGSMTRGAPGGAPGGAP
jgi:hypothetical protein